MDTSVSGLLNAPPINHVKVAMITRILRVAAAAVFAVGLVVLMSCVIYLFVRDSSTETAMKIRDMALKDIEGNLERYAQAYWLQMEEDERHLAMLNVLKNETTILKAQLAESAAREDAMNRTISTIISELAALKLTVLEDQRKSQQQPSTMQDVLLGTTAAGDSTKKGFTSSSTSFHRNFFIFVGTLGHVLVSQCL